METTQIIAVAALILALLLMVKVFSLQGKVNELRSDVARLSSINGHPGMTKSAPAPLTVPLPYAYSSGAAVTNNADLDARLLSLISQGQKIKAIKEMREATNMSLKDAKDYVDGLAVRHGY
ncbi:ribosomal protein L7/L12 [Paenibacillus donghaensis]|uniref:Large ribosomal subunit protein bL12 C-terminal domain-containing protein n=1 Tax=Paenibacillus donghaensis TaxID=414771 RepID=A0A2Z2K8M7_9BACL|nr:ribosomal protein L7/L12 [Paenibacillus donghaensis]ASA21694.1 hypothetical protein B9T62_13510 [Paenibacillus donghaensis]